MQQSIDQPKALFGPFRGQIVPEVGGEGKKVEPAQIDMDWSDICELRAWLRESSSFHNSNNVFSLFSFYALLRNLNNHISAKRNPSRNLTLGCASRSKRDFCRFLRDFCSVFRTILPLCSSSMCFRCKCDFAT